ncbi:hypothetical protein BKA65DRAFT_507317 [Rhexocercosporidium sp. MPI-PUGE-AT-0058]|nr:hypothetical protein BKA65DRAFT_507317 [Rhexocercosporidium sp. MPI-PUGE-AT-0058]
MAICTFSGNADMYGLGIRIGFYLQWFGTILATWVARKEVTSMRLSTSFFVAATFLALMIQTDRDNLRPVEIYIVLLLTFGGYLHFVPLYVWRLLVGCDPDLDPTRHPRVRAGKLFSRLNFFLLVIMCIFQLWFWIGKVPSLARDRCTEFGFLFARVRLNQRGFAVVNVVLYFLLLLFCLGILGITIGKRWGYLRRKKVGVLEHRRVRKTALQELQTFINITVVSIVVAATELTIAWNRIEDVNDIASAGQTIPLIIGIGQIVRVLYVMLVTGDDYDDDNSTTNSWTDSVSQGVSADDLPPMGMPGTPPPA